MKAAYYVVPARELAGAYAALRLMGLHAMTAGVVGQMVRLVVSSPGDAGPLSPGEAGLLALYGTLIEDEKGGAG